MTKPRNLKNDEKELIIIKTSKSWWSRRSYAQIIGAAIIFLFLGMMIILLISGYLTASDEEIVDEEPLVAGQVPRRRESAYTPYRRRFRGPYSIKGINNGYTFNYNAYTI